MGSRPTARQKRRAEQAEVALAALVARLDHAACAGVETWPELAAAKAVLGPKK